MSLRLLPAGLVLCLTLATSARANFVFDVLGNAAPAFSAGDTISVFDLLAAQSGQPAPFDEGIGSDPIANFSASWLHSFGPVAHIASASLTFGIYDNDSATPGNQLASFTVAGVDLFSLLNPLFEAVSPENGQNSQYNVYTVNLPASLFAALETGSAAVTLALQGPTFNPGIPGVTPDTTLDFNGAGLIFSRIEITEVPEPSAWILLATGGLALSAVVRFRAGFGMSGNGLSSRTSRTCG